MKKIFITGLILFNSNLLLASQVKVPSDVTFSAVGRPSFLKINGKSKELTQDLMLEENLLSGSFSFQLASLKTGIELRDEHMKDNYLQVKKYPSAILKINNLDISQEKTHKLRGSLTLHGVEREIELELDLERNNNSIALNGEFEVNLDDFKIDIPSFQGITVAKTVKVKVETKVDTEKLSKNSSK
tara:strand:- start:11659 stop:12216 length:558 start_codon:yes stop_codon:yes gene_type:complete